MSSQGPQGCKLASCKPSCLGEQLRERSTPTEPFEERGTAKATEAPETCATECNPVDSFHLLNLTLLRGNCFPTLPCKEGIAPSV